MCYYQDYYTTLIVFYLYLPKIYDRIAMGDELMIFRWVGHEEAAGEQMSADDAVQEYQDGIMQLRSQAPAGQAG